MNVSEIVKLYQEGYSTYAIAEKYNTYSQKIRRILIKAGEPLRDKGEAQIAALKSGRHKHPTEGTTRSDGTKLKISQSMVDYFDDLSEEEKTKLSEEKRKRWNNLSLEEQKNFTRKGIDAIRKARDTGSKLEKFVYSELQKLGYNPKFHDNNIISNRELEVDISIPSKLIVIEIDGPSHFQPIWGDDKLRKQQKFDHDKNALLLSYGFSVIRVQCQNTNPPLIKKEELIFQIEGAIKDNNKPQIIKIEIL